MNTSLKRLLELHPAPWRIDRHERHPRFNPFPNIPEGHKLPICSITDANNYEMIFIETFTGDGARVNVEDEALERLVEFVNESAGLTAKA